MTQPTMKEIAGWLREAANKCEYGPGSKFLLWVERAAQVEAMGTGHVSTQSNLAELAKAVRDAAVLAGICNEDVSLTGPELIMLCADMGAAIKEREIEAVGWRPIEDQHAPDGVPVLLWAEEWIDEDFNPTGVRVGHFVEAEGYTSCGWNACQDTFTTEDESYPTLWSYLPQPLVKK